VYGTEGFADGPHHPVLGALGRGRRVMTGDLSYFVPHTIDFSPSRAGRARAT
jgi:hypothetical protein